MVIPTKLLKYATQYGIVLTNDILTSTGEVVPGVAYSFTTEAKPKDL